MPRKKKPGTAIVHVPAKVPQVNGGSLYSGGVPGNRGGGRTPNALKQLARDIINKRQHLERLGQIASGELGEIKEVSIDGIRTKVYCETPMKDQINAITTLCKIGDLMKEETVEGEKGEKIKVFVLAEEASLHIHEA